MNYSNISLFAFMCNLNLRNQRKAYYFLCIYIFYLYCQKKKSLYICCCLSYYEPVFGSERNQNRKGKRQLSINQKPHNLDLSWRPSRWAAVWFTKSILFRLNNLASPCETCLPKTTVRLCPASHPFL